MEQRGAGGARAAEEAVLWHQVLVGVHRILHVLPADQGAEQLGVRGTRQVHAVVTLEPMHNQQLPLCVPSDLLQTEALLVIYLYD